MTQPEHIPVVHSDRVRPVERLPVPPAWTQDRPSDLVDLAPPKGRLLGRPGPDVGYGLLLIKRLDGRLELGEGDSHHDALSGAFAVGSARAALFGRAPVIHDFELAYTLFGFFGGAPDDLVARRRLLFAGVAHDYGEQRRLVDAVPETTLRLSPDEVRDRLGSWESLINPGP
jgi:hypothetical protein